MATDAAPAPAPPRTGHLVEGRLGPTPPFDFEQSVRFLERFEPAQGDQVIADGVLTKAWRVAGQTVAVRVWSVGTVDRPELRFDAASDRPILEATAGALTRRLERFLSVHDDVAAFYRLAAPDRPLAPALHDLHGLHQVKFATPFENACWAVMSQRVPLATAAKMKRALVERFGDSVTSDGAPLEAFPEPQDMAGADEEELRDLVRNGRKAASIARIVEAFLATPEEFLWEADLDQVESWLLAIPGIGRWSAAFVLFRGLGRPPRLLISGPFLAAARRAYGGDLSQEDAERIAEGYGAWQGYWGMYLRAWASAGEGV